MGAVAISTVRRRAVAAGDGPPVHAALVFGLLALVASAALRRFDADRVRQRIAVGMTGRAGGLSMH